MAISRDIKVFLGFSSIFMGWMSMNAKLLSLALTDGTIICIEKLRNDCSPGSDVPTILMNESKDERREK
jgi:hypothetical protein